jgi:hypothetical protein
MKAAKILSLIITGGILGFILRGISYNSQEPRTEAPRQAKSPKKPVRKTSKKKGESKKIYPSSLTKV